MALIDLDKVSKVYDRASRPALENVNLHINRGDFVFLVGASGAGKSTLLSLLLHEEEVSDGEIHVAGSDLRRISNRRVPHYRRNIGFVFQDYKLLENKTVWENVAFALEVIGTKRSTIKSIVPQVLKAVGLEGKENRMPHELSGGEAQRVAIARAYANHPQIILADEPTGNLDPTTSVGIMEVLEMINRTGTTIIMATHNEEIVNSMRKRVVELHNGRIVRDEENGMYDSALYFPDEDVENHAEFQRVAHFAVKAASLADNYHPDNDETTVVPDSTSDAEQESKEVNIDLERFKSQDAVRTDSDSSQSGDLQVSYNQDEDDSVARLARNVHSGRTGRYGEAFAPAEDKLATWGGGLPVVKDEATQDEQINAEQPSELVDSISSPADEVVESADEETKTVENRGISTPVAPPSPPTPARSPETSESIDSSDSSDSDVPPSPPVPPAFLIQEETESLEPVEQKSTESGQEAE